MIAKKPRIGIDLMGESLSLPEELKARLDLTIISTEDPVQDPRVAFVEAGSLIGMDEDPVGAVRAKKEASLNVGMRLLKEGKIDALVSFGNTGALLVSALTHLRRIKGLQRPALITLLPTKETPLAVLDVGANVTCKAEHLHQFAKIGIAYQRCHGIENPVVGLLNIGTEETKGRDELIEAHRLLMEDKMIPFAGNIEGREVWKGIVDVLITDGFTGNVFLKTAEGVSAFILERLGSDARNYPELDYASYPGALLVGLEGLVIKCHGEMNQKALLKAIEGAARLIETAFLSELQAFYSGLSNENYVN